MQTFAKENLNKLFIRTFDEEVSEFIALPFSGSERRYFRLKSLNRGVIGVLNKDEKENWAFISFSIDFKKAGLNVPTVFAFDLENGIYLLTDLGDVTLFSLLYEDNKQLSISDKVMDYYKWSLKGLIRFQLERGNNLDY